MGCLSWPLSAYIDGERGEGGKGEVRCSLVMGCQEYVIDEVFHRLREVPNTRLPIIIGIALALSHLER